MNKQDVTYYIKQLELLRKLESKNLLRNEVLIKHQDRIVAQMLDTFSGEDASEEEDSSIQLHPSREHIFISYSHKDKKWLEKLCLVLTPLVRQQIIHIWADTQIEPGKNWREEIKVALACAKVAVLLVTPDFLASDFIAKYELPPLLRTAEQGGLTILWVAVSASLYNVTEIGKYQALNNTSRPLDSLKVSQVNKELVQICEYIKKTVGNELLSIPEDFINDIEL